MLIQELITEDNVALNFTAQSKDEAIEVLARILLRNHAINNYEGFLKDVYDREEIASTGIGYGIAIPHAKSSSVIKPSVIFARCDEGVPFDSMDGKDAHLFFMIAMPEDGTNAHLKVLAMLSRKLMHHQFREDLLDAKTIEEVLALLHTMN